MGGGEHKDSSRRWQEGWVKQEWCHQRAAPGSQVPGGWAWASPERSREVVWLPEGGCRDPWWQGGQNCPGKGKLTSLNPSPRLEGEDRSVGRRPPLGPGVVCQAQPARKGPSHTVCFSSCPGELGIPGMSHPGPESHPNPVRGLYRWPLRSLCSQSQGPAKHLIPPDSSLTLRLGIPRAEAVHPVAEPLGNVSG